MKLGMVNLGGYENHLPEELSGGMQKRAGLARAMALDPMVLFFDEPSAGLDPVTAVEIDLLIKSINAGMGVTMVVVTHELQSIFNIAHRLSCWTKTWGLIAEDPGICRHSEDPRVPLLQSSAFQEERRNYMAKSFPVFSWGSLSPEDFILSHFGLEKSQ
jgi:phospholipid/cholesterol/gamma-HCH transport system ATP-binding protein